MTRGPKRERAARAIARFTRFVVVAVAFASSVAMVGGCAQGSAARMRVKQASDVAAEAEKNGAVRCAPRELALAKAHLRFAEVDLDQGDLAEAKAHLAIAEPNARAALTGSPPDRCVETARPGDRDGDGFPDPDDNCPDAPETWNGFDDNDGCPDDPDTDGDGILDSRDMCILEPEDRDGYLDEDGCPETDNDADGIPDAADKCRDRAEDLDGFQDDDGCPDPDNDADGVPDVEDMCPNTAGPAGGDRPGCPKKNALAVVTANEIRITQQIRFEFNKATIKRDSFPILDAVRDVLRENPKITLEIQGHTDNVGNAAYNKKLSQSRADSVRKYLVSHGIDGARLTAKGYGMDQPLVPNTTDANRALNRRVQFIRTESHP